MSNKNCTNVNFCHSCYSCYSCCSCYSCDSCEAVIRGLFCFKLEASKNQIFNKQVTEERFYEVRDKYQSLCGDWSPRQTNGYELYKAASNDWSKIVISKFKTINWYDSWKDMPKKAIEYIASLPEFDESIFTSITGIKIEKVKKNDDILEINGVKYQKIKTT